MLKQIAIIGILVAIITVLSSCFARNHTMSLDVIGYNHTDRDIGDFSVNGKGGSLLMKHHGGGKFSCCIVIPEKYKHGMTVVVTWSDEAGKNPASRTVIVPPYRPEDGGHFAVHFLRNGDIKVFVTKYYEEHPNYPLKGDEAKL
ncbi:DUF3304 domain-containing protein [Dyella caseinilytica]|uniref:DUF3304 domain-containing protein n=1 Tax=Dyella caseinilytica TaxID=1849581 RepID=A0ABX7GX01_9GAMM|nr:DUF3304 domain-containing protein [Dyella caseinilytica]QRN55028.1 DUF3304 domain-containing protein [Dyella caseinilytica]GFZ98802.1 hypothetical protein GCM10011408_19320 [Dyella caseinilytica]